MGAKYFFNFNIAKLFVLGQTSGMGRISLKSLNMAIIRNSKQSLKEKSFGQP